MLNRVHHVTYVVESISDMAAYMEKSFGVTPISTDEFTERGFKSILYRIGETLVDFFEPLRLQDGQHRDRQFPRHPLPTGRGRADVNPPNPPLRKGGYKPHGMTLGV